jgi:hypothetical protein
MGDDGMMYLENLFEYVKTNIKTRKGHHSRIRPVEAGPVHA